MPKFANLLSKTAKSNKSLSRQEPGDTERRWRQETGDTERRERQETGGKRQEMAVRRRVTGDRRK